MARAAKACDFAVIVTRFPPSFIAGSRCLGKIWTQFARILERMMGNISWPRTSALTGPLLLMVLLPGCDAMNGARGDLGRMTTAKTTPAPVRPAASAARPVPSKAATTPTPQAAFTPAAATAPVDAPPATLVGRTEEEIRALFDLPFPELIFRAQTIHRAHFDPSKVQMSTLMSIKTGGCPEDCGYCPQAARYETGVASEKLLALEEVTAAARRAKAMGATRFQTAVRVVVPGAISGIAAAFILGISRAVGETMVVAVAGAVGVWFVRQVPGLSVRFIRKDI